MLHVHSELAQGCQVLQIQIAGAISLAPSEIRRLLKALGDSPVGHLISVKYPNGVVVAASDTLGRKALAHKESEEPKPVNNQGAENHV